MDVNQGPKIDLIVTDYCMPEMTGYELLKKVKVNVIHFQPDILFEVASLVFNR